jgi:hypothetical protein
MVEMNLDLKEKIEAQKLEITDLNNDVNQKFE